VLLDQVLAELGVDAAAILLYHTQTQELGYAAGRGFRTDLLERSHKPLGTGFAGRAALERTTIQVLDLAGADPSPLRDGLLSVEGISTCIATPLIAKGEVEGVLEVFHRSAFTPDGEWMEFLESLAGQAAIAIDSARLFEGLQQSNQQLVLAYNATIEGWSRALDLRDKETEGHTQRVTEMTLRLARQIGAFDEEELVHIRRGALLHDIGKMGVPDRILHKPGKLTSEEWEVMRKHPVFAYQLLSPIGYLRKALDIPYCHHEWWDGSGYPQGIKGEQIPMAARIFSVVDVWDALRSNRPYRAGWPTEKVIDYLRVQAGTQFDPRVVEVFIPLVAGGRR
jgi:putative nucleotidyltransferase with HDIG domain